MNDSPLIRLSPEIRNAVYEYTFISRYRVHLSDGNCQHALTRTSRQLRQESLGMFYALTRFNAHLDDRSSAPLMAWLRTIGPEACLLIKELNVWGLHDVCLTLCSEAETFATLTRASETETVYDLDPGKLMIRPVAASSCRTIRYLSDVVDCLESLDGVKVKQWCEPGEHTGERDYQQLHSIFAVLPESSEIG